ncbi:U2 small nuclear ribonucleoprotein auxiliary factor 35 kDa subunit-related protein 2 [Spea bombifrons]|uniref:U2 small nuclear ribonucleoprotein auxiliary factor 35 kDa subunit-related protein 2 n=1 Tax=Spea bombifrons TaxID=233779 RepID=UPI0023492387|nr:U2 small nuclear ribonucleoprotein auxiliary factor 35 kDa subunit-related protein 2 [Spea bombifrons]
MAAPVLENSVPVPMNHKKVRAILKKEKRKKKRQALAKLRDAEQKEQTPSEDDDESLDHIERQRLHEEWLLREQKAQEEFLLQKEREEAAKRREEEERKLIEEWRKEEEDRVKNEKEEQQRKQKEREEAVQKMLDEQVDKKLQNGDTWHNPEAPEGYGTEKDKANCPFYLKTGACRFGDRCSRKHNYPSSSQTLLIRGMFVTYGMEQCKRDDYDTDDNLEHGDDEMYQQFLEFYEDVVPEFKAVGKVIQFKVSCNFEPHLRGNVYVQYQTEEECLQAFSMFNGRWYASRQLQCELSPVTRWKTAICGLFERQKCPRGKQCNFLHVFRNPDNEFWEANRDFHLSPDNCNTSDRRDRSYRGDEHTHSRRYRSPSPDHYSERNGESRRKKSRHHKSKKHRSHRSRSRERRSHSRGRKKQKHRSRSSSRSRSRSRSRDRRSKSRERKSESPKTHKKTRRQGAPENNHQKQK